MLTLEDIDLIHYKTSTPFRKEHLDERFILSYYGIDNCQQLLEYIASGDAIFQKRVFQGIVNDAERLVEKLNKQGVEPIYYKEDLGDYKDFKPLFDKTDRQLDCNVLPFYGPSVVRDCYFRLSPYNIKLAKSLLSKVGLSGQNAFCEAVDSFGPNKAQRLGNLMSFYDEQLMRIAISLDAPEDFYENLFYKDSDSKRQIVSSIYQDIILYLLEQGSFISKINPNVLFRSLNPTCEKDLIVRNRIIRIISNYCTLEELENPNIIKDGTLNRFVNEPKKEKK